MVGRDALDVWSVVMWFVDVCRRAGNGVREAKVVLCDVDFARVALFV